MSIERRYSLPKLRDLLLWFDCVEEGSAELNLALYDAVAGGVYWPECSSIWRAGSAPGVWREPLRFSSEEGAAIALARFALPGFDWLMRSDRDGGYANVYPRRPMGERIRDDSFPCLSATAPLALCHSIILALIDKQRRRAA
jgi:hypothetical protein